MRHRRTTTAALVVAVCALALGATYAQAHVFVSNPLANTFGVGVGKQHWDLGPFNITCEKAKASGKTKESPSEEFFTSIKYTKCTTAAHLEGHCCNFTLKTKFVTPVVIEYHANGFVEIGSEGEETEGDIKLSGGSIELKVNTIKCEIEIETQVLPIRAIKKPNGEYTSAKFHSEAFAQERNGKQTAKQKLVIENTFKKIHFEYFEGQCENFAKSSEELRNGTYDGNLLEELKRGNLEFQ
jgi:hypothetical protein